MKKLRSIILPVALIFVSAVAAHAAAAPSAPTNVKLHDVGGKAVITWDAPTTDADGTAIDPATITYTVFRYASEKVADGVTETNFTDNITDDDTPTYLFYSVVAQTSDGSSASVRSNRIVIGRVSTLPFVESFPDGKASNFWDVSRNNMSRWMPLQADQKYLQDNDGGMLSYTPYEAGDQSTYTSCRISLKGTANPVLTFWSFYGYVTDDVFTVEIARNGGDFQKLQDIDVATEMNLATWTKQTISLKDYVGDDYIQIAFNATSKVGLQTILYVDNLLIEDVVSYSVKPVFTNLPKRMRAGNTYNIVATLQNRGTKTMEDYSLTLSANGRTLETTAGRPIEVEDERSFTFEITPDNNFATLTTFALTATYGNGESEETKSVEKEVAISFPRLPKAEDLKATGSNTSVALTWTAPQGAQSGTPSPVTDGFDAYEQFTIEDFGEWTLIDGDRSMTYGIGSDADGINFPNNGNTMAYMVFNPGEAGLNVDEPGAIWQPHSGNQMLVSFGAQQAKNDNWLISPELNGQAQTLSFFAKSLTSRYGLEKFEVLTSETDMLTTSFKAVKKTGFTGNATTDWTEYAFNLPEGTRYFAIHCTTNDGYAFLVDDITYTPDSVASAFGTLKGYNVYCDGNLLIETPVSGTSYTASTDGGEHTFTVTAVYDTGESVYSNAVSVGATGIADIPGSKTGNGTAYDLQGRRVTKLRSGIYVVNGRKVILR